MFYCCSLFSQSSHPHKTDVNRDIDVIKVYQKVVEDGYGTTLIYERLATAYYFRNEYSRAKEFYDKLFITSKPNPEMRFRYGQTLKALGFHFDRLIAIP